MKRYLRILGLVAMVFTATIVKAEGTDTTKTATSRKFLKVLNYSCFVKLMKGY